MIIDPANQSFSENHKLMIGSIVPRPIALVSTISKGNINNVAPFSYFNGVCSNPPTIMLLRQEEVTMEKQKTLLITLEKRMSVQ